MNWCNKWRRFKSPKKWNALGSYISYPSACHCGQMHVSVRAHDAPDLQLLQVILAPDVLEILPPLRLLRDVPERLPELRRLHVGEVKGHGFGLRLPQGIARQPASKLDGLEVEGHIECVQVGASVVGRSYDEVLARRVQVGPRDAHAVRVVDDGRKLERNGDGGWDEGEILRGLVDARRRRPVPRLGLHEALLDEPGLGSVRGHHQRLRVHRDVWVLSREWVLELHLEHIPGFLLKDGVVVANLRLGDGVEVVGAAAVERVGLAVALEPRAVVADVAEPDAVLVRVRALGERDVLEVRRLLVALGPGVQVDDRDNLAGRVRLERHRVELGVLALVLVRPQDPLVRDARGQPGGFRHLVALQLREVDRAVVAAAADVPQGRRKDARHRHRHRERHRERRRGDA
mmetsp:Transcript_5747/g.14298  ORF Transcript_5747/g.14298 Transcript_5747/m.14298 type:complete len:402 (-) Transcript_5747:91-1296(-)